MHRWVTEKLRGGPCFSAVHQDWNAYYRCSLVSSLILDFRVRARLVLCRISPLLKPAESIILPRNTNELATSRSPSATSTLEHWFGLENCMILVCDQLMWSPNATDNAKMSTTNILQSAKSKSVKDASLSLTPFAFTGNSFKVVLFLSYLYVLSLDCSC